MELKFEKDLGSYLIKHFELEENEYTYNQTKTGYEFWLHSTNKYEKFSKENIEKTINNYYQTHRKANTINKKPLIYLDKQKITTIELLADKINEKVYKIKIKEQKIINN